LRTINCDVDIFGNVDTNRTYIGFKGEHNATQINFNIPEELANRHYNVEVLLPTGETYVTPPVTETEGVISYSVPLNLTENVGLVKLNLLVHNNDGTLVYRTEQTELEVLDSSEASEELVEKNPDLAQEMKQITVVTKTDSDILTETDKGVVLCNKATPITLILPACEDNANLYFYITNINTGTVTIETAGDELIQGNISVDLLQNENIRLITDGSNWYKF
jgi:hypothetical protein